MSAFFRFENLAADAYFLLSLVNAQKGNQEMVEGAGAEISLGHEYLAEALIERLLISLAVSVRMIEERFRQQEIAIPYPFSQQEVCDFLLGTPTPTDEKKSGVGLAADKLIHAKRVSFFNDHRFDQIMVEGYYQKNFWQVTIDMRKFAFSCWCLSVLYDENSVSGRGDTGSLVTTNAPSGTNGGNHPNPRA